MKIALLYLINNVFYREIELLYGKKSFVDVLSIKFCTQRNSYLVDVRIYVSDTHLFEESGIDSINFIVGESWKYLNPDNNDLIILKTCDIIENYSSS